MAEYCNVMLLSSLASIYFFNFNNRSWPSPKVAVKPNNSKKLITNPISPETSTKENPMKEYRNNSSRLDGFLPIEITNEA